jgi:hypothetical protein
MKTPEQTTAEVFPRYLGGEVLADSATLKWSGLFARRYRFARVVHGFLVPAKAEPLITCQLKAPLSFKNVTSAGAWVPRRVRRGDIFVTGSKTLTSRSQVSPAGGRSRRARIRHSQRGTPVNVMLNAEEMRKRHCRTDPPVSRLAETSCIQRRLAALGRRSSSLESVALSSEMGKCLGAC